MKVFYLLQTLVLMILLGCSESKETRLQKFLLKGNISLNENNPQQATYYYEEALKLDPCFADALNNLGTIQFNGKHFADALTRYEEAIKCHPEFLPAYFNRANTLYETKEYYRALEDIEHIQKAKPDTAQVYFIKGLVLTKLRKYSDALDAFQQAMEKNPANRVECIVNQATVLFYKKEYQMAEGLLWEAMKMNDQEPNIYNTLAMIQSEQGKFDRAMANCNKALELEPNQAYFLNNRGYIHLGLNQLAEAEADINQSISLDPYNGWAYRNKGIYYLKRGDSNSAERLLQQAADMDTFIDKVHYYLGEAYRLNKKQAAACEQYKLSDEAGDQMVTSDLKKGCS